MEPAAPVLGIYPKETTGPKPRLTPEVSLKTANRGKEVTTLRCACDRTMKQLKEEKGREKLKKNCLRSIVTWDHVHDRVHTE